jgi:hypothetical protein
LYVRFDILSTIRLTTKVPLQRDLLNIGRGFNRRPIVDDKALSVDADRRPAQPQAGIFAKHPGGVIPRLMIEMNRRLLRFARNDSISVTSLRSSVLSERGSKGRALVEYKEKMKEVLK